jgi:multidrug efflux pump
VLAIGLVVDDAIVVVENVHRHIEMGKPRMQAAIDAARELALPIVAMTTTLVAVYGEKWWGKMETDHVFDE